MQQEGREVAVAVGLMRMALALLDHAGESGGAARLQHAIDTVLEVRSLAPCEELPPELACLVAGIPLGGTDTPGPNA